MVSEHKQRKFDQHLLGHTFAWCSLSNSTSAIVAGILADSVAARFGPVGPLITTLPFLSIAFIVPCFSWSENYGDATLSLKTTLSQGVLAIARSKQVFLLGLMQTLFEGSMHVFVFMWTPTLQSISGVEKKDLPLGQIFSCYMACMALGSSAYSYILQRVSDSDDAKGNTSPAMGAGVFLLSGFSFLATYTVTRFEWGVLSLVAFEVTCGLYFPLIGTLRSEHIPENSRSSLLLPASTIASCVT